MAEPHQAPAAGQLPRLLGRLVRRRPRQTPWSRFLDELAGAGYDWLELGPYGYLPTDPARLQDELAARDLKVCRRHRGRPRRAAPGTTSTRSLAETRKVAELTRRGRGRARHLRARPGLPGRRHRRLPRAGGARARSEWRTLITAATSSAGSRGGVRRTAAVPPARRQPRRDPGADRAVPGRHRPRAASRSAWTPATSPTGAATYRRSSGSTRTGSATSTSSRWTRRSSSGPSARTWRSARRSRWAPAASRPHGLPDIPSVVAALAELDAELFVVVEQDMYPVDFDRPAADRRPDRGSYLARRRASALAELRPSTSQEPVSMTRPGRSHRRRHDRPGPHPPAHPRPVRCAASSRSPTSTPAAAERGRRPVARRRGSTPPAQDADRGRRRRRRRRRLMGADPRGVRARLASPPASRCSARSRWPPPQEACLRHHRRRGGARPPAGAGRLHAPLRRGYRALKDVVDAGDIGAPLMVHCAHRNPSVPGHYTRDMAITDTAVHDFDVVRWLLGEEFVATTVLTPRRSRHGGDLQDPLMHAARDGERRPGRRRDLGQHPLRLRHPRRGGRRGRHRRARRRQPGRACGAPAGSPSRSRRTGASASSAAYDAEFQEWVDARRRRRRRHRPERLGRLRRRGGVRRRLEAYAERRTHRPSGCVEQTRPCIVNGEHDWPREDRAGPAHVPADHVRGSSAWRSADLGYEYVELSPARGLLPSCTATPGRTTPSIAAVKKALDEAGVSILSSWCRCTAGPRRTRRSGRPRCATGSGCLRSPRSSTAR